nr:EOG090X0CO7 [Eulimnadia texana]
MAMTVEASVLSNGNSCPELHSQPVKTEKSELIYLSDNSNSFYDSKVPHTETGAAEVASSDPVSEENEPEIDITINNVVCSFSVRCHLNLKYIAQSGYNVEYRRENGMLTMRLRRPYITASIWSSGKVTCTGATSEEQARIAARKVARQIQKIGYPRCRITNYRVVNVLGTCTMPFAIKITPFSANHRDVASYEPELHPGVTYRLKKPKATLKIFSTGSITITAPSVANVQSAVEHIYPLVYEFRKERTEADIAQQRGLKRKLMRDEPESDETPLTEEEGDFDSDESHD